MLRKSALAGAAILVANQAHAQMLTNQGELFGFFGGVQTAVPVTGLEDGEKLLAIDRRRPNNGLYGITATRLYSIDSRTGAATAISPVGAFSLTGSSFDMEADETYIRIISNSGQNFRVAPKTGVVLGFDAPFAYRAGDPNVGHQANIVAIAYRTYYGTFFGIDADLDTWVKIDEGTGLLTTIGKWGVDISADAGFDFSGGDGHATLVTNPAGSTQSAYYELNPSTRIIRPFRQFAPGYHIVDLALSPLPEPATWAMMLLGFSAAGVAARKRVAVAA